MTQDHNTRAATPPGGRTLGPQRQRTWARVAHLAGAAVIGTSIYAPDVVTDPLRLYLQVLVIPVVTITGLFIWKQAATQRVLKRLRTRS